jgi:hypothetical protein
MINPENTVRQINHAIKARTDRDIVVGWYDDGDDGSVAYYVCADGDDTNLYVWEDATGFEIVEDAGRSFVSRTTAKTYEGIADKLIETVS